MTSDLELSKKELEKLWKEYKEQGKDSARQKLIIYYSPLAKYIAGRIASNLPKSIDIQDLIQNGILGLIDAIEKFDPNRDIKFETYALSRIKGAIIDSLRSLDWLPRTLRFKVKEIDRVCAELESKLNRPPTEEEIAEAMNISVEELQQILAEARFSSIVALEDSFPSADSREDEKSVYYSIADKDAIDPFEAAEEKEIKELLIKAIQELPEKERKVIILYYYSGLTLKEIGELLGVTESRASQLHSKAISRLRTQLKEIY
ncbi:MAG: FliA/WhiG family RNA polymerase sigma factor [Actinobacteria bacterium]|nr:FliA/WhiG family RNA polymerase sigma factor [Actinomycetota bacterium]